MKREGKQKKARGTIINITRKKGRRGRVSSGTAKKELSESAKARSLKIKWQRLISEGETCRRCGSTGKEVDKAVFALSRALAPLGIKIRLEKEGLSIHGFRKDLLRSNRILINNRLLEDWLGAEVGHSPCCDVCGPSECRTLEVKGRVYEVIPARLIIKAGLVAALALVD